MFDSTNLARRELTVETIQQIHSIWFDQHTSLTYMKLLTLKDNLLKINLDIEKACIEAQKRPEDVTLIGVTKSQTADIIRQAYREGIHNIGENYLQEALAKMKLLEDLDITWYYIGSIQSNKTRQIANNFSWIHSVDSIKIGERLSKQCPQSKTLNLLIQLNIDNDSQKRGIHVEELESMVTHMLQLPNIRIRGLMIILSETTQSISAYREASKIFETLKSLKSNQENIYWDTLSMGMSKDFYEAILSGANTIRIGTTLFGKRDE